MGLGGEISNENHALAAAWGVSVPMDEGGRRKGKGERQRPAARDILHLSLITGFKGILPHSRRGHGPFQTLFRTTGMGAAARWMQEHGMPPLARGVRNIGEQTMLIPPAEACGDYIGFVGPE
jgi:hypothetical protein